MNPASTAPRPPQPITARSGPPRAPRTPSAGLRMRMIYELHSAALLHTLLNWTYGDWQAAEDLMQETMLRAWRHLDSLNPDPDTLRPWLVTVGQRIAIDRHRARAARVPETEPEPLAQLAEPGEPLERLLDRAVVVGALHALTEVHRTALVQVYLMDRTVPEAAAVLGVPEGTVKSRLHHGLRAVRQAVGCRSRCPAAAACGGGCG